MGGGGGAYFKMVGVNSIYFDVLLKHTIYWYQPTEIYV